MTITAEEAPDALSRIFEALERRDLDEAMAVLEEIAHADCEHTSVIGTGVEGRTYRGYDGVRGWFADLLESFDVRYVDRDFRVLGEDRVLLLCTNKLRGRGSGAEVSREIGVVWWIEDGLIRRGRSYGSHAEALAAVEAARA